MFDFYKKCELSLKKHLIAIYGKNLTEEQIQLLIKKEYIDSNIYDIKTLNDTFDYLLEKMLNDLLNKQCYKTVVLDQKNTLYIPIGNTLKHTLINLYKISLSKYINYKPIIDKSIALDIDYLANVNELFDNIVDNHVFKEDINELLEVDELYSYVDNTIYKDLANYFDNITNKQAEYKLTKDSE